MLSRDFEYGGSAALKIHKPEMFAQQAELDVKVAELQVKMPQLEAGDPRAEERSFY
jgi:hypothetical protein